METFENYMPDDFYSMIVLAIFAIVMIWLVLFVVRKLIGAAIVAGIVIGGFMVWQDPTVLHTAQDTAFRYYEQWRYGAPAESEQPRW